MSLKCQLFGELAMFVGDADQFAGEFEHFDGAGVGAVAVAGVNAEYAGGFSMPGIDQHRPASAYALLVEHRQEIAPCGIVAEIADNGAIRATGGELGDTGDNFGQLGVDGGG